MVGVIEKLISFELSRVQELVNALARNPEFLCCAMDGIPHRIAVPREADRFAGVAIGDDSLS
ncbi:hypothetical protein JN531_010010 [Flagellatimonas centrodinii]|uniref:hypothetical protein n=1 Tax=Flagellatimonas centrodinii TaxID=2806210 RepID=UPI001FEE1B08|nr:hypothetical protein [Flagellatimonas centrodinii]ULQ45459.1 hypothetical protein JN531_010010 [Flagellatimonas centrodinii]